MSGFTSTGDGDLGLNKLGPASLFAGLAEPLVLACGGTRAVCTDDAAGPASGPDAAVLAFVGGRNKGFRAAGFGKTGVGLALD